MTRCVLLALAVLALAPATAGAFALTEASTPVAPAWTRAAPDPHPLTGTGTNFKIVANVPLTGDASKPAASDIELAGDYAYVGSYGEGLVIVDISNPEQPRRTGVFNCPGGQNDVQLSPDAQWGVLAIDTKNNQCHAGKEGTVVLDLSDKAKPREVAFIEIPVGSHNNTLDWPYLYVDNYPASYHKLEIFSLENPAAPRKLSELDYGAEQDSVHDLIVDHRPDGRSLVYAASIGYTDVIDVSNPSAPKLLQRFADPEVTISHQAEPNFDRSLLLVTDEFAGGQSVPGCGKSGDVRLPAGLPVIGNPFDIGALHIYSLQGDGQVTGGGQAGKVSTFNLPLDQTTTEDAGCTIHVFWQAPDQNRLVTAWYGRGTHVVDFSDPENPRALGGFVPTGGDTWSAKPHRGYIFIGDIVRGMDVLKYTGEGWPANSGAAEVQRARIQSLARPLAGGSVKPSKQAGKNAAKTSFVFKRSVRVPRTTSKRATLVLTVRKRTGGVVTRLRFRVASGRVARLRATIGARPGRYRYDIKLGRRTLRKGSMIVTRKGARVSAAGATTLVCRFV